MPSRAQALERPQRRTPLLDGRLRMIGGECPRQFQSSIGLLEDHSQLREALDRRFQRRRIAGFACEPGCLR
jgi:hypothetical protein